MYKDMKDHGNNHRELTLPNGKLHVFANDEVFYNLEYKVFEIADNNLRIPRNMYTSYTPDTHVGVGTAIGTTAVWSMSDGFVSPSIVGSDIGCGMRVHKTNLHKNDLKDKKLKRALIDAIEKYISTNERATGHFTNSIDLDKVVSQGMHGIPKKYLIGNGDIDKIESAQFKFDTSYLTHVPEKAWKYASQQIGTLGQGNHFIEVQSLVINEENKLVAEQWGLFDGQIVFMIHSGSRAWGGKLGVEYTKEFKTMMAKWGISNPDPNLVYAPIDSNEGQMYLDLMYSALNYAVVNRHMIGYGVTQAFKDVLGQGVEVGVLYDLMHNYALKEYHDNKSVLVHRKGATRALPAGHFANPKAYKETGHPALIPGSMGTSSYIMVGKDGGAKNYYSICHGAGRLRSRRATREMVTVDEFEQSLKVGTEDEVLVNHRSLQSILDECPQAYKDVDQIIDSVVGAGLAEVVAQCKPLVAIKGV